MGAPTLAYLHAPWWVVLAVIAAGDPLYALTTTLAALVALRAPTPARRGDARKVLALLLRRRTSDENTTSPVPPARSEDDFGQPCRGLRTSTVTVAVMTDRGGDVPDNVSESRSGWSRPCASGYR
jgi:hypothetical protein